MAGSNKMPQKPEWWGDNLNGTRLARTRKISVSGTKLDVLEDASTSGSDRWSQYLDQKTGEIEARADRQAVAGLDDDATRLPSDWDYETIQAIFDPARSNGKTAIFSQDGLNAVRQYQNMVQVPRGARREKLGFLVPDANGNLVYRTPTDFSAYSSPTSDNARGTPPDGAVYGMHGHIPGQDDGFVDDQIQITAMAIHIP